MSDLRETGSAADATARTEALPNEPAHPTDKPASDGSGGPRDVPRSGDAGWAAEAAREAGELRRDEFRLAGPNGVEIYRTTDVELPEFHLDRRTESAGETPRESLRAFQPERAGLPETTLEESPGYIQEHASDRRWLRPAEQGPAELQRLYTALDKGGGHAAERHGSEVTPEELRARVTRLEDPAQQDPAERARSQDAYRDGRHRCGPEATQIWDGDAFATAFARGTEHPLVRSRLDEPFDRDKTPRAVSVPIADLLGPDGHEFCSGYRLQAVDGSTDKAREQRADWVVARREGRTPDVPEPECTPIETFEKGHILFAFKVNEERTAYEVKTMFVEPPDDLGEGPE